MRFGFNFAGVQVRAAWDMVKTAANGWGTGGAASVETFAADGYAQTTAGSTTADRVFGLSTTDADASFNSIHFGILLDGLGQFQIAESGSIFGVGTYAIGDVLRVARVGSTVLYQKQTAGAGAFATLYTSLVASTGALLVDAAIFQNSGHLLNMRMSADGVELGITWKNIVGVSVLR